MPTQSERRFATRRILLAAAKDALIEHGLSGFTTTEVVRRAGLSNGALFRYFPTRAELLAGTVAAIFDDLRADYESAYSAIPPGEADLAALLQLLWAVMNDPSLAAVYEVFTASRTDAWMQGAIRPVVEDHVARLTEIGIELLRSVIGKDSTFFEHAIHLSTTAMQGLVIQQMVEPQLGAADRLIASLAALADVVLAGNVEFPPFAPIQVAEATAEVIAGKVA